MSRFNTKVSNKTENLAGGKAFSMNPEMELVHAVLTTFLEEKYYENSEERKERIVGLIGECDPLFVAKLAYVARTEFHLRSVTTLLLAELSKTKQQIELWKYICASILRVDDITELVSYLECKLPKQVKRGIRRSLYKFDRYQLAKYRGEGKGVKLVDVFNLVHPKPQFANKEQKKAWKDLVNDKLKSFDTWEVEVSASKDKKETWTNLVMENKLGYMALLRNLNNLIKNGVSKKVLSVAIKKLTDPEEVAKSKQLPFRYVTAYENVEDNIDLSDAISLAMDLAITNMDKIKGKTLIALDSSGSMSGRPFRTGAIFASSLIKNAQDVDFICFDTNVYTANSISRRDPVMSIVKNLEDHYSGGGTRTSLVFQYAFDTKKEYDRIIIISDNQSWAESSGWFSNDVDSVQKAYTQYKRLSSTDPFIYAIDIEGYGSTDVKGNKVIHLSGWSDKILQFINKFEEGGSLVEYIRNKEILTK